MAMHPTRRRLMGMAGAGLAAPSLLRAAPDFRLGLTPVFLDNEAVLLDRLIFALSEAIGDSVSLVQRRTYQEVGASTGRSQPGGSTSGPRRQSARSR